MDDKDKLMNEMWNHWEPYNEGGNGKWKSYILPATARDALEADDDCVTLVMSDNGIYIT